MGLFDFFTRGGKTATAPAAAPNAEDTRKALDEGLEKTRSSFFDKLAKAVVGKSRIDEEVLDELEGLLISSDVGLETTVKIIKAIEARVERDKYVSTDELDGILRQEIVALLTRQAPGIGQGYDLPPEKKPYVMMVVGVNGVGKTTTIGKLAAQFKAGGQQVVLGAADTFRAAAVSQLMTWGERAGVPVIEKGMNADPASVAYDAVKHGHQMGADVVIVDTAGRLHNKVNLMNELSKIRRIMDKALPGAPHEVLLVLDGSTGQNALVQAREFSKATEITSLAITKLDGTAKGGVVVGISDQLQVPVRFIGVGERIEDLQVFDRVSFVESLFTRNR